MRRGERWQSMAALPGNSQDKTLGVLGTVSDPPAPQMLSHAGITANSVYGGDAYSTSTLLDWQSRNSTGSI